MKKKRHAAIAAVLVLWLGCVSPERSVAPLTPISPDIYEKIDALIADSLRMKAQGDRVLADERWSRAHRLTHEQLEPWARQPKQVEAFLMLDLAFGRLRRSLSQRARPPLKPIRARLKTLEARLSEVD